MQYEKSLKKIVIICPIHGDFSQIASIHINQKSECPKCSYIERSLLHVGNRESFIRIAGKVHNNRYTYNRVVYKRSFNKVAITCIEHGDFLQSPCNHIKGAGCPKCKSLKLSKDHLSNVHEFINSAMKTHGEKYLYRNAKGSKEKLLITCSKHGDFLQSPNSHIGGAGCPLCNSSRGEQKIIVWLNKNNVDFVPQKTFNDLRSPKNAKLRFDFYLPSYDLLIEYDGEQHFHPIKDFKFSTEDLKIIMHYDALKNQYCNKNKMQLLRIPYTKINKIAEILEDILNVGRIKELQ